MKRKGTAGVAALALLSNLILSQPALADATGTSVSDVEGHWAQSALLQLKAQHILNGYPDGSIRPNGVVTRAEAIMMLNNLYSFTPSAKDVFTDVPDWAKTAVNSAAANGVVKGVSETNYASNSPLTRAQAVVMIANAITRGNLPATEDSVLRTRS